MAKITALDIAEELTGDEHLPIVQGVATKRVTMGAFRDLITPFLQYWYKGDRGFTGAANNTYTSYAELQASDPSRLYAYLAGDTDPQPRPDGPYVNHAGVAGTWVPQPADGVQYDAAQSIKSRLDRVAYVTDARFAGGAKGDGIADDWAPIQAAIDAIHAIGGGEVRIPEGTYKTTKALLLRGTVSLVGAGPSSVIRPNLCDGLQIDKSDAIAPRRVANLRLYAHGGEAFTGILADIAFPERATGLVFEKVFIDFFGTGIKGRGFWHTDFDSITMNQVHRGFWFYDRNIKLTIDKARVTYGGAIIGEGVPIGFQVGDETTQNRPEDVHVSKSIFFGFGRAVYWRNCLYGSVTFCDLDYCTEAGIDFVTADGGTTFSDNWIQVDNTAADIYGIRGQALGTLPGLDNVVLNNNRMRATDVKTVPGEFHSFGIFLGNNQANVVGNDNSMQGALQVSLWAEGAHRVSFSDNKGQGQVFLFNNNIIAMNGNIWLGGITLSGNLNTNFGKDAGLHTTAVKGSITVPAGQVTATVTYLSLNMPDLPQGGYEISCIPTDRGTLTHGGIGVSPTRTALTVNCDKAIPNLPSTINFTLEIY